MPHKFPNDQYKLWRVVGRLCTPIYFVVRRLCYTQTRAFKGGGLAVLGASECSLDGCLVSSNSASKGGFCSSDSDGLIVRDSILKRNEASSQGGVLFGLGGFYSCAIVCNIASGEGGVAYVTGPVIFAECSIESGSALSGAIAFIDSGTFSISDSNITTCPNGCYSDYLFVSTPSDDDAIISVVLYQGTSFSNLVIPAIGPAGSVVVRNNVQGLGVADVTNASVMSCSGLLDPALIAAGVSYCPINECADVYSETNGAILMGIGCYCYPDGQKTDALGASCASSASISDPVAGVDVTTEQVLMQLTKPRPGNAVVQFANLVRAPCSIIF